jgi:hypothetical protein
MNANLQELFDRRERIDKRAANYFPDASDTDRLLAATIADYRLAGARDYANGVLWAAQTMHPRRAAEVERMATTLYRKEKGWMV